MPKYMDEMKKEYENYLREAKEKYLSVKSTIDIPETAKKVTYYKSIISAGKNPKIFFIWKTENNLCLFPFYKDDISIYDIKLISIPVSQIEYFSKSGEVFRENKVTGGGGGGVSIGGAVIGGLVAGEIGAVLGGRKKVNEIKSELITHDTRETLLSYFENGERHSLFFDIDTYQILNDLMPEKEYNIVSAIKSSEIIKSQITNNQKSVPDQIREFAKLRDEGIITEKEFNEKKKQLLDKIS